ncbi:MAG: hypothetical protein JRN39_05145 [Nitrososphaerota archaeon]|nr:hypothetical protein [Nitrososphaerota archaeon]
MAPEEQFYRRAEVQHLLKALKEGALNKLLVKFSFAEGLAYPDVERIMGVHKQLAKDVLEELSNFGILIKEPAELRVACPFCGSMTFSAVLGCPDCGSAGLNAGSMIECLKCGHMDFEERFAASKFVCPKCRKGLKALGVDYRKPGVYYGCMSCRRYTPNPSKVFHCGRCVRTFKEDEASLAHAYNYSLNPEKKDIIEEICVSFESVVEKLKALGWTAKTPATLKGRSGIEHAFTLVASPPSSSEQEIVAEMVTTLGPAEEHHVLALVAKAFDVQTRQIVLIAVPGLNHQAKRLAEFYNIHIVESPSMDNATDALWKGLDAVMEMSKAEDLKKEARALEIMIDEMEKEQLMLGKANSASRDSDNVG